MRKYPFLVSLTMAAGLAFTLLLPCARAQATTTIYFTANDVIETFTPPGPMTNFANLPVFTNPEGLAFDTSGNLFVAGGGDVSNHSRRHGKPLCDPARFRRLWNGD
jgi:hypothetical protein